MISRLGELFSLNFLNNIFNRKHKKFIKRFAYYGENTELEFPYIINKPENISIAENTKILSNSRICIFTNHDGGVPTVKIGRNCRITYNFTLLAACEICIEDSVLIASNVMLCNYNHGINVEDENEYMYQALFGKKMRIGEGSWIGEKVCILPGGNIGKKCVIGSGSVVTGTIPDYSMAVGNPARVIKRWNFASHTWERI